MTKQKGIKFVKVETDRPLLTFYPPKYELEPRLYMEMLENKAKVKPTIRSTEWISKKTSSLKFSTQNLKTVELISASNLNSLSLLKAKQILLTPLAVNDIKEIYCD